MELINYHNCIKRGWGFITINECYEVENQKYPNTRQIEQMK